VVVDSRQEYLYLCEGWGAHVRFLQNPDGEARASGAQELPCEGRGYSFVTMDFTAREDPECAGERARDESSSSEAEESRGVLGSKGEGMRHACGPDMYEGEAALDSPVLFTQTWRVDGPRKQGVIHTTFSRVPSAGVPEGLPGLAGPSLAAESEELPCPPPEQDSTATSTATADSDAAECRDHLAQSTGTDDANETKKGATVSPGTEPPRACAR
jgi:hypothetical protein